MDELEDDCAGDKTCASELTSTLVDFDIATPYGGDTHKGSSVPALKNSIGALVHFVIPLVIVTE